MQEKNYIEELAELKTASDQNSPIDELFYLLRFGAVYIDLEDGRTVEIALNKAFLALSTVGCDVKPGSELGNNFRDSPITVNRTAGKSSEIGAGGEISLSPSEVPKFNLFGKGAAKSRTSEERRYEFKKEPVTARAGQKWEISAPEESEALDGVYLRHDKALCKLRGKAGANQKEVTARVLVKQRDMLFGWSQGGLRRLDRNKEAILNVMIGRALAARGSEVHDARQSGFVTCEVVTDHEGV